MWNSLGLAEKGELIHDLHLLVEAALLGEVPDSAGQVPAGGDPAQDGDPPLVRGDDVHDHPDGSALPGAIGTEETEDPSARDLDRQALHRGMPGEPLGDLFDFDDASVHAGCSGLGPDIDQAIPRGPRVIRGGGAGGETGSAWSIRRTDAEQDTWVRRAHRT